jgi:hypothetical protein
VKINVVSWPDHYAQRQVLRFPPPLVDQAPPDNRFDFAWKMLQYCFDFPDPRTAVPAVSPLAPSDQAIIDRFVAKASSLAGSPFLSADASVTVSFDDVVEGVVGSESVDAVFPHEESERGFLTLLRQFVHAGEEASYKAVERIACRAQPPGPNLDLLRGWGRYHKKLLARAPLSWAYRKALEPRGEPLSNIPEQTGPRVDELLRTYFYGDVIHFGEGRDDLADLNRDEFTSAHSRMRLYEGASGLAMFYMGYATIIRGIYPRAAD